MSMSPKRSPRPTATSGSDAGRGAHRGADRIRRRPHAQLSRARRADADTLTVDVVLQAIGFASNTNRYGLERLGVATDPCTGGTVINDVMETAVPGAYAVGDVTAKLMLVHVAEAA